MPAGAKGRKEKREREKGQEKRGDAPVTGGKQWMREPYGEAFLIW